MTVSDLEVLAGAEEAVVGAESLLESGGGREEHVEEPERLLDVLLASDYHAVLRNALHQWLAALTHQVEHLRAGCVRNVKRLQVSYGKLLGSVC